MYHVFLYTQAHGWGNVHDYAYVADADCAAYLSGCRLFNGAPEQGYYETMTELPTAFGTVEEAEASILRDYPHARHARSLEDSLCTSAASFWYLHGPYIAGCPC